MLKLRDIKILAIWAKILKNPINYPKVFEGWLIAIAIWVIRDNWIYFVNKVLHDLLHYRVEHVSVRVTLSHSLSPCPKYIPCLQTHIVLTLSVGSPTSADLPRQRFYNGINGANFLGYARRLLGKHFPALRIRICKFFKPAKNCRL